MYIYSLTNHRIEHKIDFEDEQFISMKIDPHGFFYETQSFKTPRRIYRVEFDQLAFQRLSFAPTSLIKPMLWQETKVPNINVTRFKTQYDSFASFDGKKVPLTIIQKSNGNAASKKPCLVFSYGGYGIPMLPFFKLFHLLFIELFNGIVGSYKHKFQYYIVFAWILI